jgi:hypothetical protein
MLSGRDYHAAALYLFTEMLGHRLSRCRLRTMTTNQHAANENLRIANLWYAMDLYAALLTMR